MSAPGDLVQARLGEAHKSFVRAELVRVVEPSRERATPPCPYFVSMTCGGCQWQHIELARQRQAKMDIVARELRKAIANGMELLPIATEVPAYHWRRRARLQYVRPKAAKKAIIGFYAPRTHRVTDIAECPQLEPALMDALVILRTQLAPHLGSRGEIEIVAGHTGQVHVAISGHCAPRYASRLVGKGGAHSAIVGVTLFPQPDEAPRKSPDEPESEPESGPDSEPQADMEARARRRTPLYFGEHQIELEPGFLGRADRFAQPSLAGNRALLAAVDAACGPRQGRSVVEFYAGSGNLTRVLSLGAAEVVAIDSRPVPWPVPGIELRVSSAAEVAAELAEQGRSFDIAVLDPPRTGAAELIEPLMALRPGRIVYVSCDPATLARDLAALEAGGYRARTAQPLDPMPQTAHVEVVATLTPESSGLHHTRGDAEPDET